MIGRLAEADESDLIRVASATRLALGCLLPSLGFVAGIAATVLFVWWRLAHRTW